MTHFVLAIALLILPAQAGNNPAPMPIPGRCSVEKGSTELRYPDSLKGTGIQGKVVLQAIIREDGCATDVTVVRKLHPELDKIAKETISSWRFKTAMKDGSPVRVKVRIEVTFHEQSANVELDQWRKR